MSGKNEDIVIDKERMRILKNEKLSYESDGKMGKGKEKSQNKKNKSKDKMFFNTTQNSE